MSSKVSFMLFLQWNNKIGLAVFMDVHSSLAHGTIVLCKGYVAIIYQTRPGLLTAVDKKTDDATVKLKHCTQCFLSSVINNPD